MKKLKREEIDPYILAALREDMNAGDLTTEGILDDEIGEVDLLAKEEGILAGLDVFLRVFQILDEDISCSFYFKEGDLVKTKDRILSLRGRAQVLLSGERTALNYLQRMSSIASYTRKMVDQLDSPRVKILDTRKTSPNMRIFEKYAVTMGGGYNHRFNLSDGLMLKDNHIAAAGGLKKAVDKLRAAHPFVKKIEVEVEDMEGVKEAIEAKADIIMLDNMDIETIKKAAEYINHRAIIECSGNINMDNIGLYRNLDIDYISSGSIIYEASCLDLSMKNFRLV